ncbi:MAG: hypothetical protein WA323_11120 [Candidatus Nitrosopolaris sp.]
MDAEPVIAIKNNASTREKGCQLRILLYVWRPTAQQGATNTTQFVFHPLSITNKSQLTHEPNTAKTIIVNSDGMTIRNTAYSIVNKLQKESIISSFIPSSLQREIRLVELAILFGVIASSVHALTSLTMWHSQNKLKRSFYSWYLTRPLIGAALAVTVYLLLRATLLSTAVNGSVGGYNIHQ